MHILRTATRHVLGKHLDLLKQSVAVEKEQCASARALVVQNEANIVELERAIKDIEVDLSGGGEVA